MTTPLVTVVIPAWNVRDWIAETLSSVLAQTISKDEFEIIVVDDASNDDTAGIVNRVLSGSGVHFTILRHDTRRGPSAARNTGWRQSRAPWIQFLDADDLIDPDKLAHHLSAAQHSNPGVAVLFSRWGRLVFQDRQWVSTSDTVNLESSSDRLLDLLHPEQCNICQTGCQIFRRTWLERVDGYDEGHHILEDVELLMRIVMDGGRLEYLPANRPLFWYRKRRGSLSRGGHRSFVEASFRNTQLVENHWRANDELTAIRISHLVLAYFRVARFFAEHDAARFKDTLSHIYRLEPAFVPAGPLALKHLARAVGYHRAEQVAIRYRQIKGAVTRLSRRPRWLEPD